jgi:lipopolysaccharide exporter
MRSPDTLGEGIQKLTLSRVVSMAVGVMIAPVLSRLYEPSHFGVVALVTSVAGILSVFAGFGYAQAIPLSENRTETGGLIRICLITTALLALPVGLIVVSQSRLLGDLLREPEVGRLAWAVPALFVLNGLIKPGSYTLARDRRYGLLAVFNLLSQNAPRFTQLALGWLVGASALHLLIGSLVGASLSGLLALFVIVRILSRRGGEARASLKDVARRHAQFPRIQLWNTALNTVSVSLPLLLIGGLFDSATAGYYSFSRRLLVLPMTLLGVSVAQAFYPEAAREWRENGTMGSAIERTVRLLARTGIFPMIAIFMLGPLLYTTVFSEKWHEAGVYSQIIAPWLIMVLVTSPISTVFLVAGRAGTLLTYNVVLLLARSGALLLGSWVGGPRVALLCFSGVSVVICMHQFAFILKVAKTGRKEVAALLCREGISAVALLVPAVITTWLLKNTVLSLGLVGAASVGYMVLLFRREPGLRARAIALLRRLHVLKAKEETDSDDAL